MQAVWQHIMVECIECELALIKQNDNTEDYTKSSVEVLVFYLLSATLLLNLVQAICNVSMEDVFTLVQ